MALVPIHAEKDLSLTVFAATLFIIIYINYVLVYLNYLVDLNSQFSLSHYIVPRPYFHVDGENHQVHYNYNVLSSVNLP